MEMIPGLPDEIGRECLIRLPYNHFPTLISVSKKWQKEIHSNEFHQLRKKRGFSQILIALIQTDHPVTIGIPHNTALPSTQLRRLSFYEPGTNKWSKLPPIPGHSTDGLPLFCQFVGVGRNLVVIGGWDARTRQLLSSVYVYDLVTAKWHRGTDIPGGNRSHFACATDLNRTVYVAGGRDNENDALRSALAYDVDECKGLYHGGEFHVIGGYQTEMKGKFEFSAEIFDVGSWKWDFVGEDKLEVFMSSRTCVFDSVGDLYKCSSSYLWRLEGSTWQQFIELPIEVCVRTFIVTFLQKLLLIGSGVQDGQQSCYLLEFDNDQKRPKLMKVELCDEFTRLIQYGYSLEV
ncbi:hypothetical protein MKW92_028132 [Papaver armeniacum]|nr:hypothetical protein MKW92_028132 [Papaver armeniacum]